MQFEWNAKKEADNIAKHGVSFKDATAAFDDANCVIMPDVLHSAAEERYFCYGRVGDRILTARFTIRNTKIRIIGAGFWRKGKDEYAKNL
jgi:uncharacterized DUF497 family protein